MAENLKLQTIISSDRAYIKLRKQPRTKEDAGKFNRQLAQKEEGKAKRDSAETTDAKSKKKVLKESDGGFPNYKSETVKYIDILA